MDLVAFDRIGHFDQMEKRYVVEADSPRRDARPIYVPFSGWFHRRHFELRQISLRSRVTTCQCQAGRQRR